MLRLVDLNLSVLLNAKRAASVFFVRYITRISLPFFYNTMPGRPGKTDITLAQASAIIIATDHYNRTNTEAARDVGCSESAVRGPKQRAYAEAEKNISPLQAANSKLVSLCTHQERRPQKSRRTWDDTTTSSSNDDTSDVDVKSERSESDAPLRCQFPLQCRPFHCLHCLSDVTLALHERSRLRQ